MIADDFRNLQPAFVDATTYTDEAITYWITIADLMVNSSRFKSVTDLAKGLFIAHHLALEVRSQQEAEVGGIPGRQSGPIASKSGGSIDISYDNASVLNPRDGHWNLTVFGTRFIGLVRVYCAGPVQVGVGEAPAFNGGAWPGITFIN